MALTKWKSPQQDWRNQGKNRGWTFENEKEKKKKKAEKEEEGVNFYVFGKEETFPSVWEE